METAQLGRTQDKMDNSSRRGLPTWDVENKNRTVISDGRLSMLFVVNIARTYALSLFKSWRSIDADLTILYCPFNCDIYIINLSLDRNLINMTGEYPD
jgi:hypothetical protein